MRIQLIGTLNHCLGMTTTLFVSIAPPAPTR